MNEHEHYTAYEAFARDLWWKRWGSLVRTVVAGVFAAGALWAFVLLAGDCGDIADVYGNDLERGGGGAADRDGLGSAGSIAAAPAPDPEAFALQARMRAWRPTWAGSDAELAEVAVAVVQACRANPWPDPARCPDLMAVLVFRESSFRVGAIGARGEVGLAQLHGLALAGESPAAALDPDVNLRLALAWLRRSAMMCRIAGDDSVEAALSAYGSGRCRVYRGARMLLRWEAEIRSVDGGAS